MGNAAYLFFQSMIASNIVLASFLGLCSFIGLSGKRETAWSMSVAIVFTVFVTSQLSYFLHFAIVYFGMLHLELIIYIAAIAATVQILETLIKRFSPSVYEAMGIFLPLITTNCLILGVAVLQTAKGYGWVDTVAYSTGTSMGYLLVMMIMAGIRERLRLSNTPDFIEGIPYTFILAGILSSIFSGFAGLGA